MPAWGKKLPPPRQGGRWAGPWQVGSAFIYGRTRKVHWKEVVCLWRVLGHDVKVKAVVARVEGYQKRFTLVSSALELTGLQMVELFAARFRQEDGFRDLKQRLGWEECRAWTQKPIERTSQAQWVTLSLLRLAQFRLESALLKRAPNPFVDKLEERVTLAAGSPWGVQLSAGFSRAAFRLRAAWSISTASGSAYCSPESDLTNHPRRIVPPYSRRRSANESSLHDMCADSTPSISRATPRNGARNGPTSPARSSSIFSSSRRRARA